MAANSNDTSVGNDTRHDQDAEAPKQEQPKTESVMKQKFIRLMTVMAYMMSVSMIAVTLSLYYIFLWNPKGPKTYALVDPCPECYEPSQKQLNLFASKIAAEDLPTIRNVLTENISSTTATYKKGTMNGSVNSSPVKLTTTDSIRASVKFAGEEAKDKLYEPKRNKKAMRVLTVIAYVFSVSLAAIMLSSYYILLWQNKTTNPSHLNRTANSTPIPKISSVGTTITRALNLVPTTPMLETTTSYIDEDTNYTTPFSQELTSS